MRRLSVIVLPVLALALAACGSAGTSSRAARPDPPSRAAMVAVAPAPSRAESSRPKPAAYKPPHRVLRPGMRGPAVRRLQRRLAALKYYPGPVDGRFGPDTLEAVWAFQETQGLRTRDAVISRMWRALARPRAPRKLVPHGGRMRVEINLRSEVLVLYVRNHVALVSHVSTGGGYYYCSPGGGCATAITPTGDFRTRSFMPGWVAVPLGQMYNPVFFIGTAFAIHGDTDVPLQPASHGCVRIPMDIAAFFHRLVRTPGTPVYIRR